MNNIKYIDENWFSLRFPNNNKDVLNNLNSEEKDIYLKLYSTYSCLLTQYLMNKLTLKECDNVLSNYKIDFPTVSERNMDIYQYLSSNFLKYFYIRNNIYLERLSQEDKQYLNNIYTNEDFELTKEKENYIERTYLNIITEEQNATNHYINYGPDSSEYYKPSNAIIIGVRFDEYFNSMAEDWPQKHLEQLEIINDLIEIIEKTAKKLNLPVKVCVINYNDFSIKKRPIVENNYHR